MSRSTSDGTPTKMTSDKEGRVIGIVALIVTLICIPGVVIWVLKAIEWDTEKEFEREARSKLTTQLREARMDRDTERTAAIREEIEKLDKERYDEYFRGI